MADYQLTKEAPHALEGIYEYSILNFGMSQARSYVEGLHACFEILADNPRMGRNYSHVKKDYRRHEYESHSVYYKITKTGVLITRVLGASQDPFKKLQ